MGRFSKTERVGVNAVEGIVLRELGWIFREQETSDFGIDAHIEIVDEDDPTGKLIGLQIKTGDSHLDDKEDYFEFRGTKVHADYWLSHSLPIILAVHLPDPNDTYWEVLSSETIRRTDKGFVLKLPKTKKLSALSYRELLKLAKSKRSLSQKAIELCRSGKESEAKELLIENKERLDDEAKTLLSVFFFNGRDFGEAIDSLSDIDAKNLDISFAQHFYATKAECYAALQKREELIAHVRDSIDYLNYKVPNYVQESGQENPLDEHVTSSSIQPINLIMANSIRFRLCLSLLEYEHSLLSVEKFIKSTLFEIGFGISRDGSYVSDPESVMRAVTKVLTNYNADGTYDLNMINLTKEWLKIALRSMKGVHEYIPFSGKDAKLTFGPLVIPNVEEHIHTIDQYLTQFITHYRLKK